MTTQLHPEGPVLVVGSGLAGWSAVREFRKLDTTTAVMLITNGNGDFYPKPALSNALVQGKSAEQLVTTAAEKMVVALGVTLMPQTEVTSIDLQAQKLITSKGNYAYRQLVLATGAHPIRLSFAGDAANEVISVNSLDDYAAFRNLLPTQARVLIMGAGLIGCEFANDLAASGHAVQVVDPNTVPLALLLPQGASTELQSSLSELGVQWHLGTSAVEINRIGDDLIVRLANDATVAVDVVLSAIGLRADTALAQAATIATDRGIVVNAALQTSAEHVYALGDNTQYASDSLGDVSGSAGGVSRTLPYVMPIMNAARALAQTLNGTETEVKFPIMPVTIKTPAMPLVVAAAAPGAAGSWQMQEPGIWHFVDADARVLGFVLSGAQTSRRAEQAKLVAL